MSKLDDVAKISEIDSGGALTATARQHEQLLYSDFDVPAMDKAGIQNVVVTGMGGSALAALVCRNWWDDNLKVPFVVTRDYSLPGFVAESTLVIITSYSGNTEEALSALEDAEAKRARIACMTSGGKLQVAAAKENYPLLPIPSGLQPRMAVWYGVKMLAAVFDGAGFTQGAVAELENIQSSLDQSAHSLAAEVATKDNLAKQIAEKIYGQTPIIYAGPTLSSAAYKWKISFNESSKNLAWSNELPEFNHNEFMGWTSQSADKSFQVIELRSDLDHAQIQKRFDISNQLLAEQISDPIIVKARGKNKIEQLLWTIQLGDFVSLYLAVLNGVDPTPVELIERLKQEL